MAVAFVVADVADVAVGVVESGVALGRWRSSSCSPGVSASSLR